jgi:hypothetical protein
MTTTKQITVGGIVIDVEIGSEQVRFSSGAIYLNRIPVMAPISAPIFGVHFLGGVSPSKMGRFAPFLATIQALSKTRVFLYT